MCVCEKCRQRYQCERPCPITVSNYEGINLLANCRNMLSGPPENFSTFVLRSEGLWIRALNFTLVLLLHAGNECRTHCSLATFSASATELRSSLSWKSTPQQVLPQSVRAGLQYNFHAYKKDHTPLFSKRVMPCMVSNLAGYIFAARNFFLWQCRKVLRVLSALARIGSQRRVRTAQCDKSKDLYLACFYDDCSQTFIALGRGRKRIMRSFAHWQCACAIGRIDVSHGSSPCRHFSKEGDKGVFVKSSLRHSFHKTTRSRSSHPCVVEMSLGYLFCTTTTFFFFEVKEIVSSCVRAFGVCCLKTRKHCGIVVRYHNCVYKKKAYMLHWNLLSSCCK